MAPNVFAVPVFFIIFRETLETSIIVSVLLAWLKQTLGGEEDRATHKKLRRQVWLGTIVGFFICICIGAGFIGAFYSIGQDHWAASEDVWEGVFALLASIIITVMGAALLRVSKLQDKWRVKLAKALEAKDSTKKPEALKSRFKVWCEKYAMFILPFITVLREGLEAVVFIGGVAVGSPASAFPLAVICGLACGCLIGYFIYKGSNMTSIQVFLIVSTCFLYLVAAGLFSKSVWYFENYKWGKAIGGDAAETGTGAGSYDIRQSVWHVNCCSPLINGGGGWGIFHALFGWQNSATYGTVISYSLYWVVVIIAFVAMRYNERHGRLPFMKSRRTSSGKANDGNSDEESGIATAKNGNDVGGVSTKVRSVSYSPSS